LLQAVETWRVDLAIEPDGSSAIRAEEAKKSSQGGDIVLEACAAQACAGLGKIRFYIAGTNACQGSACFFQMLEETLRGPPVTGNRGRSESAHFAEVIGILVAQS
jgi:hypothetical protein